MVAINPISRRSSVSFGNICLRLLLFCICIALYTGLVTWQKLLMLTEDEQSSKENVSVSPQNDWSNCLQPQHNTTHPDVGPRGKKLNNPLWLPAYPTSLPVGYSNFLTALTGLSSASKNYYRQSKTLKRCHSLNVKSGFDGVTCEIVHPIVPCQRPHPSAQSANFGNVVLVALRNPLTAFPSYQQEKAEKYHNLKTQVTKQEWITFRDKYVGNSTHSPLFEEWKEFILEWRNMDPYHVAMYLPYEEWVDETKSLELVTNFSRVLSEEGFPIQNRNDLVCLWYKNIFQSAVVEKKKHVDEGWYIPEYTAEQNELLASELRKFASELDHTRPGDEQLKGILTHYSESFE